MQRIHISIYLLFSWYRVANSDVRQKRATARLRFPHFVLFHLVGPIGRSWRFDTMACR